MVTRLVNLLGAYLGEDESLMPPAEDNTAGYWERRDIHGFHERLLAKLSRTWDTAYPLPNDWHNSKTIGPFRDELRHLVESQFGNRDLWLWKDPRTSLLLPLWSAVLSELDIDLSCIMVLRHPIDVAKSLEKRNGLSREESFGIWLNYNLNMLHHSQGLQRTLVSYDQIIKDWRSSLHRCARELSLPWPGVVQPLVESIEKTIRPELRHSVSCVRDLQDNGCPSPVVTLFRLLNNLADKGNINQDFDEDLFTQLLADHSSYSKLLSRDSIHRYQSGNGRISSSRQIQTDPVNGNRQATTLERTSAEKDVQLVQLKGDLAIRETQVLQTERLIKSYESRLSEKNVAFEQLDRTMQQLASEIKLRIQLQDEQIVERDQKLTALQAELESSGGRIDDLKQALLSKEDRLQDNIRELEQTKEKRNSLAEYIQERERMNELSRLSTVRQKDEAISRTGEIESLLAQVLSSKSWRLTEPLRRCVTATRSLLQRLGLKRTPSRT